MNCCCCFSKAQVGPILGGVLTIIVAIGIIVIIVAFWCHKRARALESKERLAARMSGMCDESEITVNTKTKIPKKKLLKNIFNLASASYYL